MPEHQFEDGTEHPGTDPLLKAFMNAGTGAKFVGDCLPLTPGSKAVHDAGKRAPIIEPRTPPFGLPRRWQRNQRADLGPELVVDVSELGFHADCRSHSAGSLKLILWIGSK